MDLKSLNQGGSARHVFMLSDDEVFANLKTIIKEHPSLAEIISRLESGSDPLKKFQWLRHAIASKDFKPVVRCKRSTNQDTK